MSFIKNKTRSIFKKNKKIVLKIIEIIIQITRKIIPIRSNQVFICSNSYGYNDSPRAIFEEIMENSDYDKLKIVWVLNDKNKLPKQYRKKVKIVKPISISYFLKAIQSKYWISSVPIEIHFKFKKKGTIHLNTWHGIPIKTIGNRAPGPGNYDWSNTDFICHSNELEKNIYIRDFKANEKSLIASGLPRNDKLYNVSDNLVLNLKEKMNIDMNKKIILYAPTWREKIDSGSANTVKDPIDWKKWEKELSNDYIVLLRTHPITTKLMDIEFNDFVMDFSDYSDINDLYSIADVLISDYSSSIYDYSILERPIICFAYDYKEYKKTRGLYVDLEEEMPSGVFYNEEDVIKHLNNMNYQKESLASKELKVKRVTYGGDATDICIEKLFKKN